MSGNSKEEIKSILKNPQSWRVESFDETNSTMDAAREILSDIKDGEYGLVIAKRQLKGRGRQARPWEEVKSGLYVTYILPFNQDISKLSGFSLVVGLVIQEFLSKSGLNFKLKWPNDLLSADKKKLGGILIEITNTNGKNYILCGIGVNIDGVPPSFKQSTSLSEHGFFTTPEILAASIAESLADKFEKFSEHGFAYFKDEWIKNAFFLGERVEFSDREIKVPGIFKGVTERGEALLETEEGMRTISAGDLLVD